MAFHTINVVVVDVSGQDGGDFLRAIPGGETPDAPTNFRRILVNADYQIYLFTAPISLGPEAAWIGEVLAEGAKGYIFVINCLQAGSFPLVRQVIQRFRDYVPIPSLVVADNLSLSGLSLEGVRTALALSSDMMIIPCTPSDPVCVQEAVYKAFRSAIESSQ
jgi:hypothetical protein